MNAATTTHRRRRWIWYYAELKAAFEGNPHAARALVQELGRAVEEMQALGSIQR